MASCLPAPRHLPTPHIASIAPYQPPCAAPPEKETRHALDRPRP